MPGFGVGLAVAAALGLGRALSTMLAALPEWSVPVAGLLTWAVVDGLAVWQIERRKSRRP